MKAWIYYHELKMKEDTGFTRPFTFTTLESLLQNYDKVQKNQEYDTLNISYNFTSLPVLSCLAILILTSLPWGMMETTLLELSTQLLPFPNFNTHIFKVGHLIQELKEGKCIRCSQRATQCQSQAT